jgi:4-amino-4-deoxy-L-arabinose transferase-like glycosyltransferase
VPVLAASGLRARIAPREGMRRLPVGPMSAAATRRTWLAAAIVALVAIYLGSRIWFMSRLPYFLDESIFGAFSYQGAQSASKLFVTLTIGKEPLQAWLGIPWQELGANPLMAMRLVSMSAGLLTVGVVGLLGRRVGGTAVGLIAAALYVALPFSVVNNGVGIEESLVTLVMAGALYVQMELARSPSLRLGAWLGLVWAVGILTKASAEAAVLILPASLLCFDFSPTDRRRRLSLWLGAVGIGLLAVLGAELLLRASGYWSTGQAFMRRFPLVRPLGQVLSDPFATTSHAWSVFHPALVGYITVPLIAVALVGALLLWRQQRSLSALMVIWILVPFGAALTFTLNPFPRHVMYVLPPALVLMAYTLVWGAQRCRSALGATVSRPLCTVLAGLLLLPTLLFDVRVLGHPVTARYPGLDDLQYVTGVPAGGAWPQLVKAIRRHSTGRRVVVLAAQADPNVVRFLLSPDPQSPRNRYFVVVPSEPLASKAQFAIVDQLPFANPPALRFIAQHHFAVVGRYPRPRGGPTITLYQRGR